VTDLAPARPAVSGGDSGLPPFARDAADVVAGLGSNADSGLTGAEAADRLSRCGRNEVTSECRRAPTIAILDASQAVAPRSASRN
jgi:hypothetical protein